MKRLFCWFIGMLFGGKTPSSIPELQTVTNEDLKKIEDKVIEFTDYEAEELRTSDKGLEFIGSHEGLRLEAYDDAQPWKKITKLSQVKGYLTIGFGHTKGVKVGDKITEDQAYEFLREDIIVAEKVVKDRTRTRILQHQFDALVSHAFNTGGSSTLFKNLNTGHVPNLKKWWTTTYITSKGVKMAGLVRRRAEELKIFLHGYE